MAQRLVPVYRPAGALGHQNELLSAAAYMASGNPVFLQPTLPTDGSRSGGKEFVAPPLEKSPIVSAIVEWIANVGPARMRVKVGDEVDKASPMLPLLNKPNPILTRSNVQAFLIRDLMHRGNAYGRWLWSDQRRARERRPSVPPNALLPLAAEKVRPQIALHGGDLVYVIGARNLSGVANPAYPVREPAGQYPAR